MMTFLLYFSGDTVLTAAADGSVKEWSFKAEQYSSFNAASPGFDLLFFIRHYMSARSWS
jgi:hypothetical protein